MNSNIIETFLEKNDVEDFYNLNRETNEIINKQINRLDNFHKKLRLVNKYISKLKNPVEKFFYLEVLKNFNKVSMSTYRELYESKKLFLNAIRNLSIDNNLTKENINFVFNYINIFFSYLVKKNNSDINLLIKHSPTLNGHPFSLHPEQLCYTNGMIKYLRSDYLRSCLKITSYENLTNIKYCKNKLIDTYADEISQIVYQDLPKKVDSFAFNGAIGALKTVRSLIESEALKEKKIIIHENNYFEVHSDIELCNTSFLYKKVNLNDENKLFEEFIKDDVCGMIIEIVYNHPEMSIINLDYILNKISKVKEFKEPKYLIIDSAHVYNNNIFSYFKNNIPKNLCLFNVFSTLKYMQAGWDISKGGVLNVIYDKKSKYFKDITEKILKFRGNIGTGINSEEAGLMAIETRYSFNSRMKRYDRNAKIMGEKIYNHFKRNDKVYVGYVTRSRLVYIKLNSKSVDYSMSIYLDILKEAELKKLPLMANSSFGMNSPQVHLMRDPRGGHILRISPGSTNYTTVILLTDLIKDTFDYYSKKINKNIRFIYPYVKPIDENNLPNKWQNIIIKSFSKIADIYEDGNKSELDVVKFNYFENKKIAEIVKKNKVYSLLDIGAGSGERLLNIRNLSRKELNLYGTELSDEMIKLSINKGIKIKKHDMKDNLPFDDESIDLVTYTNGDFGYLMDRNEKKAEDLRLKALNNIYDILKRKGILYLTLLCNRNQNFDIKGKVIEYKRDAYINDVRKNNLSGVYYIKNFTILEILDLLKKSKFAYSEIDIEYIIKEEYDKDSKKIITNTGKILYKNLGIIPNNLPDKPLKYLNIPKDDIRYKMMVTVKKLPVKLFPNLLNSNKNFYGKIFDSSAKKRMIKGSQILNPILKEYNQDIGKTILEAGPFFNPLVTPRKFFNKNIFYWEYDKYAIDWLLKKNKGKKVFPIYCDDLNNLKEDSFLKLKIKTKKYFNKYGLKKVEFDSVIISQVFNYIDYKTFLINLKNFLKKDGLIFINNVVNYGYGAHEFFSEKRPKSIPETLRTIKETEYEIIEKKVYESKNKKHQKNKRLIVVAKNL